MLPLHLNPERIYMKTPRSRIIAVCLLCLCVVALPQTVSAKESLPLSGALRPEAALALMRTLGSELTIVDVRTQEEFAQGHVPGAILAPLPELDEHMRRIPEDKPILLVCRTGRRAEAAYEKIRKARPNSHLLWFLQGKPEYRPDGSFTFN